jgi:hypothetical protein
MTLAPRTRTLITWVFVSGIMWAVGSWGFYLATHELRRQPTVVLVQGKGPLTLVCRRDSTGRVYAEVWEAVSQPLRAREVP